MQTLSPLSVPNTPGTFSAVLDMAGLSALGEVTFAVPGAAPTDQVQVYFTTNPSATSAASALQGPLLTGPTPGVWPPQIPCRYVIVERIGGTTTGLTLEASGEETTSSSTQSTIAGASLALGSYYVELGQGSSAQKTTTDESVVTLGQVTLTAGLAYRIRYRVTARITWSNSTLAAYFDRRVYVALDSSGGSDLIWGPELADASESTTVNAPWHSNLGGLAVGGVLSALAGTMLTVQAKGIGVPLPFISRNVYATGQLVTNVGYTYYVAGGGTDNGSTGPTFTQGSGFAGGLSYICLGPSPYSILWTLTIVEIDAC